jgi:hypothetical protein
MHPIYKDFRHCEKEIIGSILKPKWHNQLDAPPSSLMDLIVSPKVKTTKGEKVGARSLAHNTSRVEGCARALGWD